jgi:hypothetical protein
MDKHGRIAAQQGTAWRYPVSFSNSAKHLLKQFVALQREIPASPPRMPCITRD